MTYAVPKAPVAGVDTHVAFSFPLQRTPAWEGSITTAGTNTLTNSAAPWVANAYSSASQPYYVRIQTGQQTGRVMLITANTTSQLTVDTRTPSLDVNDLFQPVLVGDKIEIVSVDTLGSLFGTTSPILKTGSNTTIADSIGFWNDASQSYIYYFHNGTQWVLDRELSPVI